MGRSSADTPRVSTCRMHARCDHAPRGRRSFPGVHRTSSASSSVTFINSSNPCGTVSLRKREIVRTHNDFALETHVHVVVEPQRHTRLPLQIPEDYIDRLDDHLLLPRRHVGDSPYCTRTRHCRNCELCRQLLWSYTRRKTSSLRACRSRDLSLAYATSGVRRRGVRGQGEARAGARASLPRTCASPSAESRSAL